MKPLSTSLRRLLFVIAWMLVTALGMPAAQSSDVTPDYSFADITVDRSTPEANLRTFLAAVDRTAIRLEAREWARQHYDAWFYPAVTGEEAAEVDLLKTYILDSMDLSAFPDWRRESAGVETALMLRAILKAENVTRHTAFRQLRDGLWVIPGTHLQAGVIASGMRAGDIAFTADTVANMPALYQTATDRGEHAGFDIYKYFTETPGGLIPPRWAGLAHKLPTVMQWEFGSNTLFQWLLTMIVLGSVIAAPLILGRAVGRGSVRWFIQAATVGLLSNSASGIVIDQAGLSGPSATFVTLLFVATYYGSLVICVVVLGEWLGSWLSAVQKAKDTSFDTSIIRLATRICSVSAGLGISIYGISTAGVPVLGIIAGLGVGGLAVALATKPTLENILAGVILFLDDSIRVGDSIDAGPLTGTVEDIGMRSTRIRAPDGALVSVTNSELADTVIKNVSRRVMAGNSRSDS